MEQNSLAPQIIAQPASNAIDASAGGKTGAKQPATIEISAHEKEVLSVEFSSTGRTLLTASADKTLKIIATYDEPQCLCIMKGHKNAVLEAHWSGDCDRVYSCSADATCGVWDPAAQKRVVKLTGHKGIVNCCTIDKLKPNLLVSGGDDGETKLWDLRIRRCVISFPNPYQILSVAFDGTTYRVFSGCLDGCVRVYDVRKVVTSDPKSDTMEDVSAATKELFALHGHQNSITGIALTSNNSLLASCSADQTIRIWDVRPFCSRGEDKREIALTRGPTHNFEQTLHRIHWSCDDLSISCGSADRCAYLISMENVETGIEQPRLLYKLPGHIGAVTDVAFHPTERIIASASTDSKILLRRLA